MAATTFLLTVSCQAELVFHDDFDSDPVGAAPASAPAGEPDGDELIVGGPPGRVTVINAAPLAWGPWFFAARDCHAMRIERGSTPSDVTVDCVPDGAPIADGTVWIWYRGACDHAEANPALTVALLSSTDEVLGRIVLSGGEFLVEGGSLGSLGWLYAAQEAHFFLITVKLATRELSVYGSTQGKSGSFGPVPFLSPTAEDFDRLRFSYPGSVLEAFPGAYVVDDLSISLEKPEVLDPGDGCAVFTAIDLPAPGSTHVERQGNAMNENGLVVGWVAQGNGAPIPVYWLPSGVTYGPPQKLKVLDTNLPQGIALGVNDAGAIVGRSNSAGPRGVRWLPPAYDVEDIGIRYEATDINNLDLGWITGRGTGNARLVSPGSIPCEECFLPHLGHCPPAEQSGANALNDNLDVVGHAGDCEASGGKGRTATWWPKDELPRGLGAGLPTWYDSEAFDVNEGQEIVGRARQAPDKTSRPFFWPNGPGSGVELPGLNGERVEGRAVAISDAGTIVGSVKLDGVWTAVMWGECQDAPLHLHLLRERVKLEEDVNLLGAVDVNESGDILVLARDTVGNYPMVLRVLQP